MFAAKMSETDLLEPGRLEWSPSLGWVGTRGMWWWWVLAVSGAKWSLRQPWLWACKQMGPCAHRKDWRLWKVVKKRSFPLHTLFLTALPMITTSMETNSSSLWVQKQGRVQKGNTSGASCYLPLLSPLWKRKKKDRSILCFVNVLMDKCRTIQRESAVGDRGLKGSNNFFLALCWAEGLQD